jgi:hypothetical protein
MKILQENSTQAPSCQRYPKEMMRTAEPADTFNLKNTGTHHNEQDTANLLYRLILFFICDKRKTKTKNI